MRLRLRKWYLDCSCHDGRMAMLYAGDIRVAGLTLHFFETFLSESESVAQRISRVTLSRTARVSETAQGVSIVAPEFNTSGQWTGSVSSLDTSLYQGALTRIQWRRPQPAARVSLNLDGRRIEGNGYAEHVHVEATFGRLPFQQIRWGRFIGRSHHVTWIDWEGDARQRWVFVDDTLMDAITVSADCIQWQGGGLDIQPGRVLREDGIATGLSKRWRLLFPPSLLSARESRWVGSGCLRIDDRDDDGDVVHETVTWA